MFKPIADAMQRAADDVTARKLKGGVKYIGIPSGFMSLDILTGGFRNGEVYVFGARTGMGKSAMALTIAKHQCTIGCNVGYITLEMSAEVLAYRWLAADLGISNIKIERGYVTAEELTIIQNKAGHLRDFQFLVDDSSYSSDQVAKALEQMKPPLDVLYIDYLTLFRDAGKESEAERLARISANLKDVAKTFDIPVVVLVQLNREVEKRSTNRPTVADIRGSGAPEQDAGFVGLLYRPHYYEMMNNKQGAKRIEEDAELIVVKNRYGPMGNIPMRFYAEQMKWAERE